MTRFRQQKTVGATQSYSGVGIHSGHEVEIRFVPAQEGEGIFFRRVDLPGKPVIPATIEYIADTARGTTLAIGEVKVQTVEHVLAALRAYEIDNICVELSSCEPPAGNGSSDVFVEMLDQAGICEQEAEVPIVSIKKPIWWSLDNIHIIGLPNEEYKISYTLHYPKNQALGSQYFDFQFSQEDFCSQIASCRTFALYEEISYLMDRGLIQGGSLANAVVVKQEAIISKGGLYFPDEAVRHKILDLVGDLSLVGIPFTGHIIAIMSGHTSNCAFAKELYHHLTTESEL